MTDAGIYIHVPFCRRKCRYCDFASAEPKPGEMQAYAVAVAREMELRPWDGGIATVYFGGGTPSLLEAGQIAQIISGVRENYTVSPHAEITIEANPLDVTPEWAEECLNAGANRISIGVQSTSQEHLAFLGRLHASPDGLRAVNAARDAGFREIGIDFIYGLPGQTPAQLRAHITEDVEQLRPEHISCYQLTYSIGTPLWHDVESGAVKRLSNDEEHELFVMLHELLPSLGYPAYEVSNFSLGGAHRSKHNSNYWRHVPYIGLGPAAHSFIPPVRSWNYRSLAEYLPQIGQGILAEQGSETLSPEQLYSEMVMLALRTTDGLDMRLARELYSRDILIERHEQIRALAAKKLIKVDSHFIRPTLHGLVVADMLAQELA